MGTVNSTITPWFATTQLTSPEMRHALAALAGASPTAGIGAEAGVLPAGGTANAPFAPTSNGTGTAPSVSVAPGQAIVNRPTGGIYVCTWPTAATVQLDLALPSGSLTRIDLLVCEVVDPEADSGATSGTVFRCRTIAGVPSSSPTVQPVPAGAVPLFQWRVNSSGAITDITSRRPWTRAAGAPRLVEPGDTRAGSHPGDLRIFATGRIDCWITGAWVTIVAPSVWTQENVVYSFAGEGANPSGTVSFGDGGTSVVRYKRAGNDVTLSYAARYGASGFNGGTGAITTVLPQGWVTPAGRDQWIPAQIWINDPASGLSVDFAGMALIQSGSGIVRPFYPSGVGAGGLVVGLQPHRMATAQGLRGSGRPFVENGFPQGGAIHILGTVEIAG